jgi:type 1 fimbriae regulatory protein FimB
MLRHSCGFALANMGIDTRLIQDYLGHRNIRHTVWYTASNAGRFYGIWDNAKQKQRNSILQCSGRQKELTPDTVDGVKMNSSRTH